MADPYVTVQRDGSVALVSFDRKRNLNAFDGQLTLELTEVARSFHDDLETRAVVLTGSKDYFSAGADLEDMVCETLRVLPNWRGGRSSFRACVYVKPGSPCHRSLWPRWSASPWARGCAVAGPRLAGARR